MDSRQYYPAMEQLESYQASRQQNGFPRVHLMISNSSAHLIPVAIAQAKAMVNVEKTLLTGE